MSRTRKYDTNQGKERDCQTIHNRVDSPHNWNQFPNTNAPLSNYDTA